MAYEAQLLCHMNGLLGVWVVFHLLKKRTDKSRSGSPAFETPPFTGPCYMGGYRSCSIANREWPLSALPTHSSATQGRLAQQLALPLTVCPNSRRTSFEYGEFPNLVVCSFYAEALLCALAFALFALICGNPLLKRWFRGCLHGGASLKVEKAHFAA